MISSRFGVVAACLLSAALPSPVRADNASAPAPTTLDGEWDGALDLGSGLKLRLAFHIVSGPQGPRATFDSVDQGVYGAPATSVTRQGDSRPLDGRTEFEIGSVTKVFTALLLSDMVRRGEVALDDPISRYLPAGVNAPTHDGAPITLVDLATHTSGLPRLPTNMAPRDPGNPYADYDEARLDAFLTSHALPRDPGATWEYSNLGFGLLGHLLARRAGEPYETLLKSRILNPLGMADTTITLTPDQSRRLAAGHDSSLRPAETWDLGVLEGAGALRSTADDLLTFLAANLDDPAAPLRADLAFPFTVRRPMAAGGGIQALGWELLPSPSGEIVEHSGGTGGYRAFVGFNRKSGLGVVVLTNAETVMGADDIGRHILTGAPLAPPPPPTPAPPERHAIALPASSLDELAGRYQLAPEVFPSLTRDGDHLMAQITGQGAYEIFPESPTAFFWKVVDAQLTFHLDAAGRAQSIVLHQNGRDIPGARAP